MAAFVKGISRNFINVIRPNRMSVSNVHTKPIRYPEASYNDMTKPGGPWKAEYDRMNAEYSRYMYAGLATFFISLGIALYTLDVCKYMELPHKNTPEGLAFLNPDPDVLADIQN